MDGRGDARNYSARGRRYQVVVEELLGEKRIDEIISKVRGSVELPITASSGEVELDICRRLVRAVLEELRITRTITVDTKKYLGGRTNCLLGDMDRHCRHPRAEETVPYGGSTRCPFDSETAVWPCELEREGAVLVRAKEK